MFTDLSEQPQDKIMLVMQAFAADRRAEKMDLGVGVYKDAQGHTPVMRAVKAAERRIWESQDTKVYTRLAGDVAFLDAMARLILGPVHAADRVAAAATVGGTGAVHQALQLVRLARPGARVHLPQPTWANHPALVEHVGLKVADYRYFDPATGGLDKGLFEDLAQVGRGDVVLLHGCCHNPTGANPTVEDWRRIAAIAVERGFIPLVDLAYQGFGDSLDEDAEGTRILASTVDEMLIAASCSKNFGIYRDRAGAVLAVSRDPEARRLADGALTSLNRMTYSFAPDHGARIVSTILGDDELRAEWEAELADVRAGMKELRRQLAASLRAETNSDRFDFIADHRGMFSLLGLTPEQVDALRERFGIYLIGDSRMNIAGLNSEKVPLLARAIASVL